MWEHYDHQCQGIPVGINVRLYNGINGYISKFDFSDTPFERFEDRVRDRMLLHARIEKIDTEKVSVRLVSRGSGTSAVRYIFVIKVFNRMNDQMRDH